MRRHAGYVVVVVVMLLGGMAGRVFAQAAPGRVTGPLTVASPNGALVVTLGTDGQLT